MDFPTTLLCVVAATLVGLSCQSPLGLNETSTDSNPPSLPNGTLTNYTNEAQSNLEQAKLVQETLQLIQEGDAVIHLDENYKDIVLVLGNTGAGKTTITKFIADVESLESYDAEDRYLIRDKQHKISQNSTIVSQTIFPELIIDNATNTPFYDLPGFSDTRNASVEIANAWFMKKIADHAEKVKLLFIVNYFSLRTGETRTNFKTFLENAVKFVKSPSKFKSSIALVATKVESNRDSSRIIGGIVHFLQTAKKHLDDVFPEKSERRIAHQLIHAMLAKDAEGNFSRISYFKQPNDEGQLSKLPDVMAQRPQIIKVIYNNTNFTETSAKDFGFSLSPSAVNLLLKVVDELHNDITEALVRGVQGLLSQCSTRILNSPLGILGKQLSQQKTLEALASNLSISTSRKDFHQNFRPLKNQLKEICLISEDTLKLPKNSENLQFLQQISPQKLTPPISSWLSPFSKLLQNTTMVLVQKTNLLNSKMQSVSRDFTSKLLASYRAKLEQTPKQIPEMEMMQAGLLTVLQKLEKIISALEDSETINTFLQELYENQAEFFGAVPSEQFILTEDIAVENEDEQIRSELSRISWLQPFHQAWATLNEEQSKLKVSIENETHRLAMEEAERERIAQEEEQARLLKAQQEEQRLLEEEAAQKKREHDEAVRKAKEDQRRKQKELERQLAEQRALIAKMNEPKYHHVLGIRIRG